MRIASPQRQRRGRDDGIALITIMMVLALVASVALAAIDRTSEELQAGGRSRASTRALFAADAGVRVGLERVLPPRDTTPFNFNLADGTSVQSRKRTDATPQSIAEAGFGKPPEEYSINLGSGFANEVFRVNVTASGANGTMAELEAKLGVLTANLGGS